MRFRRQSKSKADSEQALENAQKKLREIKERGPEVTHVARSSREARARNHFMDQFEQIFISQRPQSDDT